MYSKRLVVPHYSETDYSDMILKEMIKAANMVRKMKNDNEIMSVISTRHLIQWASKCRDFDLRTAYELSIGSDIRTEDRRGVRDAVFALF